MGALLEQLREFVVTTPPPTVEAALARAETLLGGPEFAAELTDPAALVALAEQRAAGLREEVRLALEEIPLRVGGGLHQLELDPRPTAAFATLTFMQRGGIYTPSELREMSEGGRIPPAWHAREALRFLVLMELWPLVFRPFQTGKLVAGQYPVALTELAEQLARVKLAAEPN